MTQHWSRTSTAPVIVKYLHRVLFCTQKHPKALRFVVLADTFPYGDAVTHEDGLLLKKETLEDVGFPKTEIQAQHNISGPLSMTPLWPP